MKSILIWDDNDVHLYPIDCYVWHIAGLSAAAGLGLLPESYCRIGTGFIAGILIAGFGLRLLPDCHLSPFVTGRRTHPVGLDIGRRPCYNDFAD